MLKLGDTEVARIKMPRQDRAKQFAPFDALKGLHDALRLKEYQHERVNKGEISEETAIEISKTLLAVEKGDMVKIVYFVDGHEFTESGYVKILFDEKIIKVGEKTIQFDYLRKIEII